MDHGVALACRIFSAYGENKAKIEVSVGPEFAPILQALIEYADLHGSSFIVREGRAPRGHLERVVADQNSKAKKAGD